MLSLRRCFYRSGSQEIELVRKQGKYKTLDSKFPLRRRAITDTREPSRNWSSCSLRTNFAKWRTRWGTTSKAIRIFHSRRLWNHQFGLELWQVLSRMNSWEYIHYYQQDWQKVKSLCSSWVDGCRMHENFWILDGVLWN